MRMREVEPRLPIEALTNGTFLEAGEPGASPWLGGLDIDDFGGSLVAAASFGADAISPVHIATMDHLISLGVDGLITDFPDRLRALLDARGFALPRRHG